MQTFLPYPDLLLSARCLDNKRLGKQRVECKQIYCALRGYSKGWVHHPAVKMWRGYELWLRLYWEVTCHEWRRRGFKDNLLNEAYSYLYLERKRHGNVNPKPLWWGGPIHDSHKRALLAKDYEHYSRYFPGFEPKINYHWPTKAGDAMLLAATTKRARTTTGPVEKTGNSEVRY